MRDTARQVISTSALTADVSEARQIPVHLRDWHFTQVSGQAGGGCVHQNGGHARCGICLLVCQTPHRRDGASGTVSRDRLSTDLAHGGWSSPFAYSHFYVLCSVVGTRTL